MAPTSGGTPKLLVRIFDTTRNAASSGAVIEAVPVAEALHANERGALITSSDPAVSRTNIGVRALGSGATATLTLCRADGSVAATTSRTYGLNSLLQESVEALFGVAPAPSDSVVIEVTSGAAIAYAATVNNTTQELSWYRATRITP